MNPNTLQLIGRTHSGLADYLASIPPENSKTTLQTCIALVDERILTNPELLANWRLVSIDEDFPSDHGLLASLSEQLDMDYFAAREAGATCDANLKFQQARFAYALAHVAKYGADSDLAVVVYELAHTYDEPGVYLSMLAERIGIDSKGTGQVA